MLHGLLLQQKTLYKDQQEEQQEKSHKPFVQMIMDYTNKQTDCLNSELEKLNQSLKYFQV